ncbi:MAG TPA: cupin domain-containing protein [Saprospiraceae bacterium]|nr:cupin domain-containing protein [Saprospiraceae bacterium]HMQ84700.1 cupin domain-containing protein [Saprospiraceae bacterium]
MTEPTFHVSLAEALEKVKTNAAPFIPLFEHGSLYVEMYQPDKIDHQQPHTRDEVYVIAAGGGTFLYENQAIAFEKGDFLFVPAGVVHRFVDFTADFATWVLFYGPEGGEKEGG